MGYQFSRKRLRVDQLATVSDIDTGRFAALRGRGRDTRAFRAARRHSRRVRLLRVLLPVGFAVGLLILALASWFNPLRVLGALPGQFSSVLISGTRVKMEAPRLAGFTRDARPYEFVAKSAAQDLRRPDLVELQDISAKVLMPGDNNLMMSARSGFYDSKKELLTLLNDIVIKTPAYEGYLQEALVEMRAGRVVSERPVEVKMLQGTLKANRLEMIDSGRVVTFTGGVTLQLKAGALQAPQAGEP